jgi:hypothetical protein
VKRFFQIASLLRLCLLVAQPTAHADPRPPRVVPMLPQGRPALPDELRAQLHEAAARGLTPTLDAVRPTDVRIRLYSAPDLLECDGAPCAPRVAHLLHAQALVLTSIDRLGKRYTIHVRTLGPDGRDLGPIIEETCDICTVHEAAEATERATSKVAPLLVHPKLATRR